MDYLIVCAHPNPKSFNMAIRQEIEKILTQKKKTFAARDLYQMKFNPVLAGDDFMAFKEGKTPKDIETEQKYIREADKIIFIYPIWWFGMPAALKGYIDRVFSYGFAYEFGPSGLKGLLGGKKVMIVNTTGGANEDYDKAGFNKALQTTVNLGVFGLCAMEVILHKFFYAVPQVTDEARKKMLGEIQQIVF